jgi:hypothetical protein
MTKLTIKKKSNQPISKWVFQKKSSSKKSATSPPIKLPEDCNNPQLLVKIFNFLDIKNLLKFSTVCKKWNKLINPLINKRLRLLRPNYISSGYHDPNLSRDEQFLEEVGECIRVKGKYSNHIREFKLNKRMSVDLSIDFFETFCKLTKLHVDNIKLSQDLLINCIKPLVNLKTLDLSKLKITESPNNRFQLEAIKLPDSLTKLYLTEVQFLGDPQLALETLNSHSNLMEFRIEVTNIPELLTPLKQNYPTLQKLLICDGCYQNFIINSDEVIKNNEQLLELEIHSIAISTSLMNLINEKLIKLKVLILNRILTTYSDHSEDFMFTKFTQLEKLIIYWYGLEPASIDSILTHSPMLSDLQIQIGSEYASLTPIIRDRCKNLKNLTFDVIQVNSLGFRENLSLDSFFDLELIQTNYPMANNLTSLNLGNFNLLNLQPDHLNQFENLKIIQFDNFDSKFNLGEANLIKENFSKFGGWKLKLKTYSKYLSGYLIRDNNKIKPFNWESYHYWNQ